MPHRLLSEKEKLCILREEARHIPILSISKKIRRNFSTVYNFLKRYKERGTIQNRTSTGRPKKLTLRETRRAIRTIKKSRSASIKSLKEISQIRAGRSTINRAVKAKGYDSRKPSTKPKLTPRIMKLRREWCKKYKDYTVEDFESWIFSDEFPYSIGKTPHGRVRRMRSEYLHPDCSAAKQKFEKKKMGWGAFCIVGVSDLVWIDGAMDSELYIDVLKEGLNPMFGRLHLLPEDWTFQEDGDPKHQSEFTKAYKRKRGLKFIEDWPPNSPDLNPIENLWSLIKSRTHARQPKTLVEGQAFLYEEWRRLEDSEMLISLIHSMPKRIKACLKAGGGLTKY